MKAEETVNEELLANEEVNEDKKNSEVKQESIQFHLAYRPNEFSIAWDWKYPIFARVGFMHDDLEHGFVKHIQSTARKQQIRLLHLTSDKGVQYESTDVMNLLEFELAPTEEGLIELEAFRMQWVQLYLKMICYINGKDRSDFIPQMKYFRTQEGPLAGYLRAIDEMPESNDKALILSHVEKLVSVNWGLKLNEEKGITDFVYNIEGNSFNEKLESFFIGAWSVMNIHYARDFNTEKVENLLTLIQLGDEFMNSSIDVKGKEIIEEITKLVVQLTFPSIDELALPQRHALFIQSPTLFPLNVGRVSHMFYGVERTSDFDLHSMIPDLKPFIRGEALYQSVVVLPNNKEFVKKVQLMVEE